MLAHISKYEEKVRFMKALTRQKTLQCVCAITADSDINSIAKTGAKAAMPPMSAQC